MTEHPRATITPAERALIDAHIARHGVTVCPPFTYSPEPVTPRNSWGTRKSAWSDDQIINLVRQGGVDGAAKRTGLAEGSIKSRLGRAGVTVADIRGAA